MIKACLTCSLMFTCAHSMESCTKTNWWQTWGTADASTDPCQVKAQQWHCRLHGLCRRSFRKGRMGLGGVLWCATVRVRRQSGRNSWLGNSSLQLRKSGSSSIFAWCLALRLCPEFRVVLLVYSLWVSLCDSRFDQVKWNTDDQVQPITGSISFTLTECAWMLWRRWFTRILVKRKTEMPLWLERPQIKRERERKTV